MNDFLDRIGLMGIRHPWRVIAASLLALLICAALASTMTVDSSRHTMVSEDNPHQALQMPAQVRLVLGLADALQRRADGVDCRRAVLRRHKEGVQVLKLARHRADGQDAPHVCGSQTPA